MKNNILVKFLAIGSISLAMHVPAHAMTITPTVNSDFSVVTSNSGATYYSGNKPTSSVLWWKDNHCSACAKSRLHFNSLAPANQQGLSNVTLDSPFILGAMRFTNLTGSTPSGVQSAELNLSVLLWDTMIEPLDLVFGISVEQAAPARQLPNRTSSDILSLTFDTDSYTFITAEGIFQLSILGWSNDRGNSFTNSVRVVDNAVGKLRLYGELSMLSVPVPTAVPVPAAAWLFGSGLLGLVAAARRHSTGK